MGTTDVGGVQIPDNLMTPGMQQSAAIINSNRGGTATGPDVPHQIGQSNLNASNNLAWNMAGQNNAEVAGAYTNPDQQAIQGQIQHGYGNLANQNAAQAQSPLAGLTTLGKLANAGTTNAGMTAINTAPSNALTQAQMQQINALNAQANGQGPSVAQQAAQQIGQQNVAAQMAMAGSQRGASNSALGQRAAQTNMAAAQQQAIQQGVQGRTAEEMAAQQQLTGALGQTQGQVMQGAQAQAQLNQGVNLANAGAGNQAQLQNAQAANQAMLGQGTMNQQTTLANQATQAQVTLANLQAKMQTQGLNTQEYNDMLQAQMALSNNDMTAAMNYEQMIAGQGATAAGLAQGLAINDQNNQMGLVSAGIGAAAAGGAAALQASDRRLKENIKPGARSMKDFLAQIGPTVTGKFNLWEGA